MSRFKMILADNSEFSGYAVGTPDEVYAYLADGQQGIKRLEVTQANDLTWPSADESPNHN